MTNIKPSQRLLRHTGCKTNYKFKNYTGQHKNVSVTKIVDYSSIQCAETKYGFRIKFLVLVIMIYEVWLNA